MIRTKDKNYHQILVDGKTYSELHLRYGASRSFNEVITEILQHHEVLYQSWGTAKAASLSLRKRFKNNDNKKGWPWLQGAGQTQRQPPNGQKTTTPSQ